MPSTPPIETPTPPGLGSKLSSLYSSLSSKATQAATNVSSSIPQHPALDSIQHQLRSFQQHQLGGVGVSASSSAATRQLQLSITSQKGLALDLLACSRDGTLASKESYEWGKTLTDEPDLVDATDRLAYLSFSAAQLSGELAKSLDLARAPLKELRDLELDIQRKSANLDRASAAKKPDEELVGSLRRDLAKLQESVPLRRREAVVKSNQLSWTAYTEYSSKLLLLSHASSLLLPTLESGEWDKDYASHVRSSAQIAVDRYEPGKYLKVQNWPEPGSATTPSFSESHHSELSSIHRDPTTGGIITTSHPTRSDSLPSDAARQHRQVLSSHHSSASGSSGGLQSPPLDDETVGTLNFTPTAIPLSDRSRAESAGSLPGGEFENRGVEKGGAPTVAETGVPLSSGPEGPGPIQGQLKPRTHSNSSPSFGAQSGQSPFATGAIPEDVVLSPVGINAPALPPRVQSPTASLPPVFSDMPATTSSETAAIEDRARQDRRGSLNPFSSDGSEAKNEAAGGPPGYRQ